MTAITKVLSITRTVIDFAIALHMLVVGLVERLTDRSTVKAMQAVDAAIAARHAAEQNVQAKRSAEFASYSRANDVRNKLHAERVRYRRNFPA